MRISNLRPDLARTYSRAGAVIIALETDAAFLVRGADAMPPLFGHTNR